MHLSKIEAILQKKRNMAIRQRVNNPFLLRTVIPDEYFCDRVEETNKIISYIKSGNNVVLSAPRRLGKTSMLYHILDNKEIKKTYNTLFVDIYNTYSPEDFISTLFNEFKKAGFSNAEARKLENIQTETRHEFEINLRPLRYNQSDVTQRKQLNDNIIDRMFDFFEKTSRPNLIVFDEFQQIEYYDEKITTLLRSKIQKATNSNFIFSGSSIHMLNSIFNNYNQPFYRSATQYSMKRISCSAYTEFCERMFSKFDKSIEKDAVRLAYSLSFGQTEAMQQLLNKTFDITQRNGTASCASVKTAVNEIINERDEQYKILLHEITEKDRNLVFCMAQMGIATKLTSADVIRDYNLKSASSVQTILNKLTDGDKSIVEKLPEATYRLRDRYLEFWIAKNMGILEQKFQTADALYNQLLSIENPKIPSVKKQKGIHF